MYHIMDCSQKRRVFACNISYFKDGAPHPSRLMPDTHDLIYVCQGEWEISQGKQTYTLGANDVLLLHAGIPHYGLKPCQNDTTAMYIHFSVNPGDAVTSERDITSWPDAVLLSSVTHCARNERVKALFAEVIHDYFSNTPNVDIKLSALIVSLLYELFLVSMNKPFDGSEDELVAQFLQNLRLSPHINYTLKQAADELFVSQRTLSSHIKRATGMSFADYQKRIKLDDIRRILVNEPQLTISDIALNHGFCDESHLSKVFKKAYDISPSQFRRQSRVGGVISGIKPSSHMCE